MALTTFSDLAQEARERVQHDAIAARLPDDGKGLEQGGAGATAYAQAVGLNKGWLTAARRSAGGTYAHPEWHHQHVQSAGVADDVGLRGVESAR